MLNGWRSLAELVRISPEVFLGDRKQEPMPWSHSAYNCHACFVFEGFSRKVRSRPHNSSLKGSLKLSIAKGSLKLSYANKHLHVRAIAYTLLCQLRACPIKSWFTDCSRRLYDVPLVVEYKCDQRNLVHHFDCRRLNPERVKNDGLRSILTSAVCHAATTCIHSKLAVHCAH